MMENDSIHKKIAAALESLDNIQRAGPRPFLFTRIEARMQNSSNIWNKISSFVARPVIALACIFFVLFINAAVIVFFNIPDNSLTQSGSELTTADEYSQLSSSLYEFENSKP
jgi:hypothetical protein